MNDAPARVLSDGTPHHVSLLSRVGLLPYMEDQPRHEAEVLLLGVGPAEHLPLQLDRVPVSGVARVPDGLLQLPDEAVSEGLRLPLIVLLLLGLLAPTSLAHHLERSSVCVRFDLCQAESSESRESDLQQRQ